MCTPLPTNVCCTTICYAILVTLSLPCCEEEQTSLFECFNKPEVSSSLFFNKKFYVSYIASYTNLLSVFRHVENLQRDLNCCNQLLNLCACHHQNVHYAANLASDRGVIISWLCKLWESILFIIWVHFGTWGLSMKFF